MLLTLHFSFSARAYLGMKSGIQPTTKQQQMFQLVSKMYKYNGAYNLSMREKESNPLIYEGNVRVLQIFLNKI